MPRVYVVHNHQQYDTFSHSLKPKYDVSPASRFGEIVEVYAPEGSAVDYDEAYEQLYKVLEDYTHDDFILCIGNPVLIGWAIALAADASSEGVVNCLIWSGRDRQYQCVSRQLF